MSGSG
jgi:hypothetical protein